MKKHSIAFATSAALVAASASAESSAPFMQPAPKTKHPVAALDTQPITPNFADPTTEILDLEEERNQRLTVPVMIEGMGPYDFMIDTGSQATAVTHQINEGLSLTPLGTAILVGMASRRPVNVVEVDSLTVGSYTIEDLEAPVLDRQHVGADGIIGLDSLQDFRVLMDFREETIALEDVTGAKNSHRGFEIVVRARSKLGQLLITDALVEGVRATVIIDTGAQMSLANNALRDRIRRKRATEVETTDVNGVSMMGQMALVRSLKIEGLSLTNVPLTFADAPAFEALGLKDKPVLSLGMQHLKMFDRVAIDFSRQRILFDIPRDIARQMRRSRRNSYSF